MGALAHAPRHSTSLSVNNPSAVVSASKRKHRRRVEEAGVGGGAGRNRRPVRNMCSRGSGGGRPTTSPAHAPPSLMFKCFSMAALISSLPLTMHGVVPQSWMKYLPTRSLHPEGGRRPDRGSRGSGAAQAPSRRRGQRSAPSARVAPAAARAFHARRAAQGSLYPPVEHGVERRHLVDAHRRHAAHFCHLVHGCQRQEVAALPLRQVQQRDDAALLVVLGVLAEDDLDDLVVLLGEVERHVVAVVQVIGAVLHRGATGGAGGVGRR